MSKVTLVLVSLVGGASFGLTLGGLGIVSIVNKVNKKEVEQREKRLNLAKNSFESGCYAFAQGYGGSLKNTDKAYKIYNLALDHCPKLGENFKAFIANSP
jgi:hypothetical protein